jgi:hypothetical protein
MYDANWHEKKLVSFSDPVVFGSLDLAVVRKDAAGCPSAIFRQDVRYPSQVIKVERQ